MSKKAMWVLISTLSGKYSNILGAGDTFGAGFLYGHVKGWGWYKAARLGNACGAMVVTAHGCANVTPIYDEVIAFVDQKGGF